MYDAVIRDGSSLLHAVSHAIAGVPLFTWWMDGAQDLPKPGLATATVSLPLHRIGRRKSRRSLDTRGA